MFQLRSIRSDIASHDTAQQHIDTSLYDTQHQLDELATSKGLVRVGGDKPRYVTATQVNATPLTGKAAIQEQCAMAKQQNRAYKVSAARDWHMVQVNVCWCRQHCIDAATCVT